MAEDILKLLANPANQAILTLLRVEPTYPRKIGDLLSLPETEVARRLRAMEGAGVVKSAWKHIGKNVKMYELAVDRFTVQVAPEGMRVEAADGAEGGPRRASHTVNPFPVLIPESDAFIGRTAELKVLTEASTVLVTGLAGIGKTSLVAHHVRDRFPAENVFWHTFRGVESLNWIANRLGLFMAQHGHRDLLEAVEEGTDAADKRARVLAALAAPDLCFVLEDLHRIEDQPVADLLTDSANQPEPGHLILTSREHIPHNPAQGHIRALPLGGITDDDVADFFAEHGQPLDKALLPRLREEVGGHPLALQLFLQAMRQRGVAPEGLLDRVPEEGLEEYLLQEIHDTLEEDERRVMGHASIFRAPFHADDLGALSDRPVTGPLLRLRKRHLIQGHGDRYTLHEVIRNFFYTLLQDKKRLHEKLARHLLQAGTLETRLEAMHHYLQAGRRDKVLRMVEEDLDLREFDLVGAGYQALYLETLGLFDRDEVTRPRHWALIQDEKGDIWHHRGEHARALEHYDEAAAIFGEIGEAARLADLAWKRALCRRDLGDTQAAKTLCEEGLGHAEEGSQERARIEALVQEL